MRRSAQVVVEAEDRHGSVGEVVEVGRHPSVVD